MKFSAEELKYLQHVLRDTNTQGREHITPSVDHHKLIDKIKWYEDRLRYG
tara:strand:+ start:795 stop:944 length:150 start_codon:yes stop_codon:yes gene_type:complete